MLVRAYEDHRATLEGYLLWLTRDKAVAEEIAQEAFARLVREVRAGRPPTSVHGWLRRVGANLAMSRGRRLQVAERKRSALVMYDLADSAESVVLRREDFRRLRAALACLRQTDREALLLAAAGLSGVEISGRIGRSDSATRTLLCRARHRLRAQLALAEGAAVA
jgi:RNA polymerase sigma-70 factor (ECF subfamily)